MSSQALGRFAPLVVSLASQCAMAQSAMEDSARRVLQVEFLLGFLALGLLLAVALTLRTNRRLREEIEGRRSLEHALTENEERLRAILRSAPEGVITVDSAGRITYWNSAAEQIFGYSESEALGRNAHELLAPGRVRSEAETAISEFAATGSGDALNQIVESEALHRDGHEVPIDIARASFRQNEQWHAIAFVRDVTARRQSEAALFEAKAVAERSRRRLLDMSDALPCAVYQIRLEDDGSRRYTFVSKKVIDVLGVDLDTLRADEEARWRNVVEEDRARVRTSIEEAGRMRQPLYLEYRVELNGRIRWIRQEANPQQQPDGGWAWNGYWLDITDVKQAEATLSDQLLFQRLLLDALPNPVFFKGPDGRYLGCNLACEQTFGIRREDIVGRTSLEISLFPESVRAAYHEADLRLIAQRRARHLQTRVRFLDGREHEVLYWATAFELADGRPGGLIGVIVDISEQKRVEELVKETERWYRGVLETAPDGLLVVDAQGRITLVNAQIEALFGYPREELIDQRVEMLVPASMRGDHAKMRQEYAAEPVKRAMGEGLDLHGVRKDGSEFPIEIGLSPLPQRRGEALYVSASIRDISDRRRAEQALREAKHRAEEATRAKSIFLANMSHEIRTPMNAIIGMSHLALRTDLAPRQRDYVDKIHGAAISLLGLINDILDFSKIEAGKLDIEKVEFSLDEVLGSLTMVIGHRAEDKGLEFLYDIARGVPGRLVGDPLRLGQILTNLVNNAVKFTESGEIELSARTLTRSGDRVKLLFAVRDTGTGMNAEQLGRLFQPFTQADGSTTRHYGGTGLGLTICKRLVELMGGSIWADSAPGRGSTFSFTAWFDLGAPVAGAGEPGLDQLRGVRALVVDDNAAARGIIAEALHDFGLRVELADSAEAAFEAIARADASDPFRLALIDWRMPGTDGIAAARRLRSLAGPSRGPTVILVTAYGDTDAQAAALAAGVEHVLVKPVSRTGLRGTLDRALAPSLAPVLEQAPAGTGTPAQALAGTRVLLVEDNDINREIALELLRAAGISVDIAANGRVAIESFARARAESYDAILMDIQMPEIDGYQATTAIRATERGRTVPIIAMTAHAFAEERQRCLEAGMNDHLAKPIDPDALFAALSRWCLGAAAGAAAKPPEAKMPEAAALDRTSALTRMGGDRRLYASLLRRFMEEYGATPERLGELMAAGSTANALRLAHALRGVAGNLGANGIADAAAALETALRFGEPTEAALARLGKLGSETERTLPEIARELARELPEPAPSAPADFAPGIRRLATLLLENDSAALDQFRSMREQLRAAFGRADFQRLERAIQIFDFDDALDQLKRLAAEQSIAVTL